MIMLPGMGAMLRSNHMHAGKYLCLNVRVTRRRHKAMAAASVAQLSPSASQRE